MSADDVAIITTQLARLELRMTALESVREDMPVVMSAIIETHLAKILPGMLGEIVTQNRVISDAQRYRDLVSLGRKLVIAVLTSSALGTGTVITVWLR